MAKQYKRPATWQEAVDLMARCPACGVALKGQAAKICAKDSNASKIHLTCRQCGNYALIVIVMMKQGVSSMGMVTDLSYSDVNRLSRAGALELDEIIDAYDFLQTNELSLTQLKLTV